MGNNSPLSENHCSKRATVILTHDVDRVEKTYQYLSHAFRSLIAGNLTRFYYHAGSLFSNDEPYWNFPKIINLENQLGVRSTFFFLNESIRFNLLKPSTWKLSLGRYNFEDAKVRNIIKYLDENGWEIGLHGSFNSYKDKDVLCREKEELEKIIAKNVKGVRQHYLNLGDNTWKYQSECGFEYDSSFGYKDQLGFKDGRVNPFKPFKDSTFTVYPLTIMDSNFMKEANKWAKFEEILKTVEKSNSVLVINWHQRVFNENEFPGYVKAYKTIINRCMKCGLSFRLFRDAIRVRVP